METAIIGREENIRLLKEYIATPKSEFIAVYGRRRVGKTFLIKELFEGKFSFRITAMDNVRTSQQLSLFYSALRERAENIAYPNNWQEAFVMLGKYIETLPEGPKIIFIDELPWFDTPKSDFVQALEWFWNSWADYRHDVKLIVSGSATSWMTNKLFSNRGGLHNRVTHRMYLAPFTLKECENYFNANGFGYSRNEILTSYMVFGGVAYYLSLMRNELSVAQNVDNLLFVQDGQLVDEFETVYKSLFKKADMHLQIIHALSTKFKGLSRDEIIEDSELSDNGNLTTAIKELEQCGFVRAYQPLKNAKKNTIYQIVDPFTLFYLRFVEGKKNFGKDYWLKLQDKPELYAWQGYAFEIVCLLHLDNIIKALGISGMLCSACSWAYKAPKSETETDEDLKKGCQIDLVIDRPDKTVELCEMKFSNTKYTISSDYWDTLHRRIEVFRKVTKTTKSIIIAMVTNQGLSENSYSRQIYNQVTADSLFA